jgi:hypothetical protein
MGAIGVERATCSSAARSALSFISFRMRRDLILGSAMAVSRRHAGAVIRPAAAVRVLRAPGRGRATKLEWSRQCREHVVHRLMLRTAHFNLPTPTMGMPRKTLIAESVAKSFPVDAHLVRHFI